MLPLRPPSSLELLLEEICEYLSNQEFDERAKELAQKLNAFLDTL